MWSEPVMRAPRRGCWLAYSSRMAMSPGISVSAIWISLRPQSARLRSVTTWSWGRVDLAVALISRPPYGMGVCERRCPQPAREAGRSEPGGKGSRRNAPRSCVPSKIIHDTRRLTMLTAADFIRAQLKRLHAGLDKSMAELTPDQLHRVPAGHPKANTIAWGIWHYVRTEDNIVRWVIQDRRPPIWTESGYGQKLGLPPAAQGTGMSTEEAQALRIKDIPLFREYMTRVCAGTDELIASASPALLEKVITVKPLGDMTVVQCLGQVGLTHGMTHLGEIELARTLIGA